METIQVSKLKQYTNDVIADVENGAGSKAYAVTVHGRETGVVLVHKSALQDQQAQDRPDWHTSTVDEVKNSGMYSHIDDGVQQQLLKMIEDGRDAMGEIGDPR